jgi:hypothetical protein
MTEDLLIRQQRTTVAATGITKPLGAVSSVFDAGRQAKPAKIRRPRLGPPENVVIKSGVPLPVSNVGRASDVYTPILRSMKAGDMVELKAAHGRSLQKRAKVLGIKTTSRMLGPDVMGVWRIE